MWFGGQGVQWRMGLGDVVRHGATGAIVAVPGNKYFGRGEWCGPELLGHSLAMLPGLPVGPPRGGPTGRPSDLAG